MLQCFFFNQPPRCAAAVVLGVRFQTATQMRLAQDNHMIDALTPNRSDQPLSKTTLPRRGWCHGPIAYAHGAQSARSEEHTSELQSQFHLVCRLLLEKK